ncbi:MAG: hypothetical protein WC506_02445 [Candidatus Micrarchaeia archaeon]
MEIFILPSVHILSSNKAHVRRAFDIARPDCLAVELCMARLASITSGRKPSALDMLKNPMLTGLFFIQQSLGLILGAKPGEEMIEAAKISGETKTPLLLADVPIDRTMACISKAPLREKLAVILPQRGRVDVDFSKLEGLASPDVLAYALMGFEKTAPRLYSCLISARNDFIFKSVLSCNRRRVLLIVGAGHAPGIIRLINSFNANSHVQISYKVMDYQQLSGGQAAHA